MEQLKLFNDNEFLIEEKPNFCTQKQKDELIEKWANAASDYGYDYNDEEDLGIKYLPLFNMKTSLEIRKHLSNYLSFINDNKYNEYDELIAEMKEDEDNFIETILTDISVKIRENVVLWSFGSMSR